MEVDSIASKLVVNRTSLSKKEDVVVSTSLKDVTRPENLVLNHDPLMERCLEQNQACLGAASILIY